MGPARAGLSSPQFCWQSEARPSGTLCTNSTLGDSVSKGTWSFAQVVFSLRNQGLRGCFLFAPFNAAFRPSQPKERLGEIGLIQAVK